MVQLARGRESPGRDRRERPLWAARLLTGVGEEVAPRNAREWAQERTFRGETPGPGPAEVAALFVVFHHVLADGVAGLAVLAGLVDGAAEMADPAFPRPAPSPADLAVDAARHLLRNVPGLAAGARRVSGAQ